ncbi:hypothetical protein BJY04DRAFT_190728 [Aspergillus karnatakaensis]|uniref:uncharacterized protein n=1 Tax=Aspergillus karnatakaensis TaxID=1810916 RepID=UPI003CCE4214
MLSYSFEGTNDMPRRQILTSYCYHVVFASPRMPRANAYGIKEMRRSRYLKYLKESYCSFQKTKQQNNAINKGIKLEYNYLAPEPRKSLCTASCIHAASQGWPRTPTTRAPAQILQSGPAQAPTASCTSYRNQHRLNPDALLPRNDLLRKLAFIADRNLPPKCL